MPGEGYVLIGVVVTAILGFASAAYASRNSTQVSAQQSANATQTRASEALETAWEVRLAYRDERIEGQKQQLVDQGRQLAELKDAVQELIVEVHNRDKQIESLEKAVIDLTAEVHRRDERLEEFAALTAEVERLTQLLHEPGGSQHG